MVALNGPGKYDDLCSYVMDQTQANLAVVLVYGGNRGEGFSVQTTDLHILKTLPDMLETMAQQIREMHK